jgi:hypothetical protein
MDQLAIRTRTYLDTFGPTNGQNALSLNNYKKNALGYLEEMGLLYQIFDEMA